MQPPIITAKIVEDSISHHGVRLTSFQLCYPRFIHAELLTHREPSRSSSSSRAVPVSKMVEQVFSRPASPIHWGKNQKGMQAREELEQPNRIHVQAMWAEAAVNAAESAAAMAVEGAHKQVANRVLEPFQYMHVIFTATTFDNWFELRDHPDADPNIEQLAKVMRIARDASTPVLRGFDRTLTKNWHLPYVSADERTRYPGVPIYLAKLSSARSARVSYLTHDGDSPDADKDLGLFMDLVGSRPLHASPTEHQGTPAVLPTTQSGNFKGWRQFRKVVEAHVACGETL